MMFQIESNLADQQLRPREKVAWGRLLLEISPKRLVTLLLATGTVWLAMGGVLSGKER
jgi:hypothetical protein